MASMPWGYRLASALGLGVFGVPTVQGQPLGATLWERAARAVIVVGLLAGYPLAMARVIYRGGTDFVYFYNGGLHILEHGTRHPFAPLNRYWPSADVPWVLAACLPLLVGASIWYAFNTWSFLRLLKTMESQLLVERDDTTRRRAVLASGIVLLPLVLDGLLLASFHILMVWLMLAGLLHVRRGRPWLGASLLGVAIWLKLLPLLGAGYLLLKRRWLPAIAAVVIACAINIILSLAAFGVGGTWIEHARWWNHWAAGSIDRELTANHRVDEDRLTNQSLAVTLRRLCSSLGSSPGEAREQVRVIDLSSEQLQNAYKFISGALLMAIFLFCRRSDAATSPRQASNETALVVLATLWFSPVVWSYHPTAAMPALAIIFCRCPLPSRVAWMLGAAWLIGILLLLWPTARAAGDLFWLGLLTGGVLAWTSLPRGQLKLETT